MEIEKTCTVSGTDIRALLFAPVDVSIDTLANGTLVRQAESGSLRLSLSFEGEAMETGVNTTSVKYTCVLFTPGTRYKAIPTATKFSEV